MHPDEIFRMEREESLREFANDKDFKEISLQWVEKAMRRKYVYNFEWLGRPIIQFPQDIIAVQEIIWSTRPDLIIETGIAHGGSLVLSASILAMLDLDEAIRSDIPVDLRHSKRRVLGIDIDIREHNRKSIEEHAMASRISMIQGSSIDTNIIGEVRKFASRYEKILVFLDSNHTYDHVLAELNAYAKLVSVGSYCVVFDTFVNDVPKETFMDRPWGPGNNPKGAVIEFLKENSSFEIDDELHNKLMITVAPDGFLRRMSL